MILFAPLQEQADGKRDMPHATRCRRANQDDTRLISSDAHRVMRCAPNRSITSNIYAGLMNRSCGLRESTDDGCCPSGSINRAADIGRGCPYLSGAGAMRRAAFVVANAPFICTVSMGGAPLVRDLQREGPHRVT